MWGDRPGPPRALGGSQAVGRVGFPPPPRFILIFDAGTDFGGSLELSTPRCGRDIEVIVPDRFVPEDRGVVAPRGFGTWFWGDLRGC